MKIWYKGMSYESLAWRYKNRINRTPSSPDVYCKTIRLVRYEKNNV